MSKSIKILFVMVQPFDPTTGGVQMSTYKLSKYFSERGLNTFVFSFSDKGHINQQFTSLETAQYVKRHANSLNLDHLSKYIDKIKPNIVINQMPYEHAITNVLYASQRLHSYLLLGCLRNTLYSIKLNLNTYLQTVIPQPLRPILNNKLGFKLLLFLHKFSHAKDLKRILTNYDYFVMFGPPNNDEIKYFIGNYKNNKLAYIPNSIPQVASAIPIKEKRILWLSRLSYKQKRAEFILPVWKKIFNEIPEWQLDIVGDGDAINDLKQQIAKEQIPRVMIHGKRPSSEFFENSPIYFMTSSYEGFPNTVIEAQSFGAIPVVFNSYPMLDWIINDKKNGVLVNSFDIESMANEIIKIAKDDNIRNLMMTNALENANRFVIDKVGQQWIDFFELNSKVS